MADPGELYAVEVLLDEPRELARHLRNCAVLGGALISLDAGQSLRVARWIESRPVVLTVIEERPWPLDRGWLGVLLAVMIYGEIGNVAWVVLGWLQ